MLKLLREELRPALQKRWSTEAANVASAVAASEDDRASTAASSIDFITGQLVQNGVEAAQKLPERLAAWMAGKPFSFRVFWEFGAPGHGKIVGG